MKHINEFGQIQSQELRDLMYKLEAQVQQFLEDGEIGPMECQLIAKHLSSGVSYVATSASVRAHFKILNGDKPK
ncbi:hypothetical protein D3C75_547900 [compost metagenome]